MKCRYCNRPVGGNDPVEWRVELDLYVCDEDYEFPSLVLNREKDAGERQRYEAQKVRARAF